MKVLFTLLLLSLFLPLTAKTEDCFSLEESRHPMIIETLDNVVNTNMSFKVPIKESINGLSIDGYFSKLDKKYLLRVILKDIFGKEYLIMESYNEINEETNVDFSNYGEETLLLNRVQPDSIIIIAIGVKVELNKIRYVSNKREQLRDKEYADSAKVIKRRQAERITNEINNYNRKHDKLWRAGVTELSLASYEDRKRVLGLNDNNCSEGIEYYVEGIFEIGDIGSSSQYRSNSSSFVDSFDWRNRHGKNWITSNKDQGNSGFCCAFTAVGVVEAMTRLYYNRLISIDLSEQEAACCNGTFNPWTGMAVSAPLNYIKNHGVCDENAYPFVNDSIESLICRSSTISPNEQIRIGGYMGISASEDSLKSSLINKGPLASSIHYWGYNEDQSHFHVNHAMPIVGYGQLHEGDTIYHWIESNGFENGTLTVRPDDPRIGRTYWIYKNSFGTHHDSALNGYIRIIHYDYTQSVGASYYCLPSITSMIYSDADIICEDADGDGLYFWGIGPKPSHCPSWVPDEADGDDSDINYGSLDSYGNLDVLPAGTTIKTPVTYSSNSSTSYRLGIVNGGILTITGTTTLTGNARIRVCEGGTLVVDGGTIQNADITMVPGSTVILRNGGRIIMASGKDFNAPKGVIVNIESGEIQ